MDETVSLEITKNCNTGKIYNTRWVLEHTIRDYGMQIDAKKVKLASLLLRMLHFESKAVIRKPVCGRMKARLQVYILVCWMN